MFFPSIVIRYNNYCTGISVLCWKRIFLAFINDVSVTVFRKIIELHRTVRGDIYRDMMKQIAIEYVAS
jgi:hypothetical protein